MGYFRRRIKVKENNTREIWLQVVLGLLLFAAASSSSLVNSSEESTATTTTSRAWPNHEFFLDVISSGTKQNTSSEESSSSSEVDQINPILTTINPTGYSRMFNINSNPNELAQQENLTQLSKVSDLDDLPPLHPLVSTIVTEIPLQIIDNRKYRYLNRGNNTLRTFYGGGVGFNSQDTWRHTLKNVSPTPKLNSQTTYPHVALPKVDDTFGTAPSIPLFTGPTVLFETALESPLRIPSRQLQYTNKLPLVNWGLAEIKITSTAPKIKTFSYSSSTVSPEGIWNKSDIAYTFPPILRPTTTTQPPIPPIAEPGNAAVKNDEHLERDLLFKIWTYTNETLKLESEKVVPGSILQGHNFSDGQLLNVEHIPLPMKKILESAFNITNSVIKRHSGPGSIDAFHWQQLPFGAPVIPTISPPLWVSPPKKSNPIAVNYIIWSTTTTPRPLISEMFGQVLPQSPQQQQGYNYDKNFQHAAQYVTTSSPPPPIKDSGYDSWLKFQEFMQSQISSLKNTKEPQKNENNNLLDKDILASVASMALILSKINKDIANFPDSLKVGNFNNGGLGLNPTLITQDQVWSSLLPIFMHHLKYGQSAITTPLKRTSTNSPLWNRDSENAFSSGSDSSGEYSFYPQQNHNKITTKSPIIEDNPYKTSIFKVVKKGIKKLKNKRKSKKHSISTTNFNTFPILDPGNPDINYAFGQDILGTIQRVFSTILALKIAPLVILPFLVIASLAFVVLPKLLKGVALSDMLWRYLRSLFHHHHHHPHHNHHHEWALHHNHHGWAPDHNHHGWGLHQNHDEHGTSNLHHHFYDRTSKIDNYRADAEHGDLFTEDYPLYDTDLDTAHNRKVMEILMKTKNATLHKLLESWELNSPLTAASIAASSSTMKDDDDALESHRRKKRKKK